MLEVSVPKQPTFLALQHNEAAVVVVVAAAAAKLFFQENGQVNLAKNESQQRDSLIRLSGGE